MSRAARAQAGIEFARSFVRGVLDAIDARKATPKLRVVRVLRVNPCTFEHEFLMEDGSVQTLPVDRVEWVKDGAA